MSFHFSWLCTTYLISYNLFLSVPLFALNIAQTFFFSIFCILLTGTVRRFLEKFADIELVVFAVENADEVMGSGVILFSVK